MIQGLGKWSITLIVLPLVALAFLLGVLFQAVGAMSLAQQNSCSAPVGVTSDAVSPTPGASSTASRSTLATPGTTPTAGNGGEDFCFPSSQSGAAVVAWAKKMADALYVNPACGDKRGGNCNDTWYTSAFPKEVIQYGQTWCQSHGDCADWTNGTYQCVSFVRGAYSQVYPMKFTNDAFGLWATYQNLPGWQEIPAAATPDVAQRFLPEPGDVMVFKDLSIGHVSIVLQVQPPANGQNGWIEFANANSSSAYDRMPLMPNLLVDTREWDPSGEIFTVWGYIRPKPAAAQRVVRANQLDPAQYASQSEYQTWASPAYSAVAMTEVRNAYGRNLRIHDVLTIEARLPEMTPTGGLQEDVGIVHAMRPFGFKTTWGENWPLVRVVVTGGDLSTEVVTIADSLSWDRTSVSVAQFLQ